MCAISGSFIPYLCCFFLLFQISESWLSSQPFRRASSRQHGLTDFNSFTDTTPPTTVPLAPHTFAGMVEAAMAERFKDAGDISRVAESWRLLDKDYEHHQWFQGENKKYLQYCHSYVPGLTAKPFWDTSQFEWCSKLQSKFSAIRAEFLEAISDSASLEERGNNIWAGALTQNAAEYGESWRTLVLMDRGRWDSVNCNLFPVTAKAVHDCGVDAMEVFFARMQPETKIEVHTDFTNFVLTSHLPLVVPYSGTNQCRLTVGDTTRQWIDGELMIFDTSLLHDAINDSDQARYILMIRLWHPDLTETEKQALQFTFDCLGFPDLVSDNPEERFRAELDAQSMRSFPKIDKLKTQTKGFGGAGAKTTKRKARR